MKTTARILTVLLALALVLSLPLAAFAAEEKVYVLDATTDLEAFAASEENFGATKVVGTDNYFTIMMGEKIKVDGSSKEFEDGYTASQRINFGGKSQNSDLDGTKEKTRVNYIKFTTEGAAVIKLWWVCGGDGRQMAVCDAEFNELSMTSGETTKNSLYISELQVDAAGTYYIAVPDGSNYLFKAQVTVTIPDTPKNGDPISIVAAALLISGGAMVILPRKKSN